MMCEDAPFRADDEDADDTVSSTPAMPTTDIRSNFLETTTGERIP